MNTPRPGTHIAQALRNFIKLESAGGTILLLTAIAALVIANSPLSSWYDALIDTPVAVQIGALVIDKPLLLWVNDGLMAVFFFLIGLEVKREFLEGELSSASQVVLPAVGALGGMVVPALFYAVLNWNDAVAMDGWAIPVATDIAFALALLSVFGSRVPITLKVFLLSVAIFDDLAAIGIIAVFYSDALSLTPMLVGGAALLIAVAMNRLGITRTSPYILVGVVLWAAVLKSGVHATLAGVLIALCIILPVFAFANAGLSLTGLTVSDLTHPVTLGGRDTGGPEPGAEQVEVAQGFIHVRCVNAKVRNVGEPHTGGGEHGFEIVERQVELRAHVVGVLRRPVAVDCGLTGAAQLAARALENFRLVVPEIERPGPGIDRCALHEHVSCARMVSSGAKVTRPGDSPLSAG